MLIQYISHRQWYKDTLYGTGEWLKEEVKDVPDSTAKKMLRHPDVYATPREEVGVVVETVSEQPEVSESKDFEQEARDAVAAMSTKEAVADYAQINFGVTVPKTLTLENMKQRATTLIDQYGVR